MENHAKEPQPVILDELALEYLRQTSKWTKFMSIAGFVFLGLALIIFLVLMVYNPAGQRSAGFISVLPMVVIMAVYFLPLYYLLQFSILSRRAVEEQNSFTLTQALQYQKMHYRYVGIMMICVFVLYAIIGVMALVFLHNGFAGWQ